MQRPGATATRPIGAGTATALVIGHTIAVGVFLTPAEIIGALRSPALIVALWLACGALVLAGALAFGELASRFPRAGGPYVYLREAWGEPLAFLYGWQCLLIMDPGVTAALAAGAAGYLVVAWPAAAGAGRWLAVAIIWSLTLVSLSGLRASTRFLGMLTTLKVLALAGVVALAFGAGQGSWTHLSAFTERRSGGPPLAEALALGLVGAFFSFGGFWEASRLAGEVRDPRRTLPLALAIGVTAVTVIYVATTLSFIYLLPVEQATSAADFARRAGTAMLGESGPGVLALVVVMSVVASLAALLLMAPRLYVAMSDDRVFPASLARVDARRATPTRATLLLATLASGYALLGTFQQIVAFFICTALVFIALSVGSLFVLRGRGATVVDVASDAQPPTSILQPRTMASGLMPRGLVASSSRATSHVAPHTSNLGTFMCPGHPWTPAAFVLLVIAVVVVVGIARPVQAASGFALLLLGLPAYRLLRFRDDLAERRLAEGAEP